MIFYTQQPNKNTQVQWRRDRTGQATRRGCMGSEIKSILVQLSLEEVKNKIKYNKIDECTNQFFS
jgi:hypothetical protein